MTITTEEARNLMRTRIPYSGYLLDVCEERDQLRAQLRESYAQRLEDHADIQDRYSSAWPESAQRLRASRRAYFFRRWAESVRMGRDIPAWKDQP